MYWSLAVLNPRISADQPSLHAVPRTGRIGKTGSEDHGTRQRQDTCAYLTTDSHINGRGSPAAAATNVPDYLRIPNGRRRVQRVRQLRIVQPKQARDVFKIRDTSGDSVRPDDIPGPACEFSLADKRESPNVRRVPGNEVVVEMLHSVAQRGHVHALAGEALLHGGGNRHCGVDQGVVLLLEQARVRKITAVISENR